MTTIVDSSRASAELSTMRKRMEWLQKARPGQLFDEKDLSWTIGVLLAGRGYGKTRPFAEDAWWFCHTTPKMRYHVVARTDDDVRTTCYEGESGIMNCIPPEILKGGSVDKAYNKQRLEIDLANDSKILGFSAKMNGQLRGPQCHRLWGDELAAWEENGKGKAEETYDVAMLGCRLPVPNGTPTRAFFSTTPRPLAFMRKLKAKRNAVFRTGSTHENLSNLSQNFRDTILAYEGTTYGRQEIYGEIIDPEESGIIKRSWLRLWPAHMPECKHTQCPGCNPLPVFEYVIISYDTALTEQTRDKRKNETDYTACTIWGVFWAGGRMCLMLIDCWDKRVGFPELRDMVAADTQTFFGPEKQKRRADVILVEDTGSGISLRQELARTTARVVAYNPGRTTKLQRLHMASPYLKNGLIWLPESERTIGFPKSWCNTMIEQLCTFTGEDSIDHDDYVDSTTQVIRVAADMEFLKIPTGQPEEAEQEKDYHNAQRSPEFSNPYAA